MRIALLTNLVSSYRLPVYRKLAATPGWQLRILVGATSSTDWDRAFAGAHELATETLDVEVVRSWTLRRRVDSHQSGQGSQWVDTQLPLGLISALRRFRPDAIISSELGARSALAALYAWRVHIPLVIWSYQSRAWAAATSRLRRAWQRALLARADAVVGMGQQARDVLRRLGVPDTHLHDAPNAHDAEGLRLALARCDRAALRAAQRASLGCRPRVALVAGRLVAAKGLRPLLNAWRSLDPALREDWTLLFVGDGPLRAEIDAAAAAAMPGAVLHLPSVPAADMASLYVSADLLIFPSLGDPWGLVVNEALACGVPVLCSRLAGCADDLLEDAEVGWCFDPTDPADFSRALRDALGCDDLSARGARGCDRAKCFGPERMADGLRRAIAHAAGLSA